jgi:hypothetical protein
MSISSHHIAADFDMGAQGLAGVLHRARQDRLALQAQADEIQASRNLTAVARAAAAMRVIGRLVLAYRSEVAALDAENARLKGELSRMRSRALEAEGRLVRIQKGQRTAA